MFFLSLALLGQSVTLDADTGTAARQCAAVFTREHRQKNSMQAVSQSFYLGMVAAKAEEQVSDTGVLYHVVSIWMIGRKQAMQPDSGSRQLAAACDKRFPLARATAPVALPADQEERDALCAAIYLNFYYARGRIWAEPSSGPADGDDFDLSGSSSALTRFEPVFRRHGYADANDARPLLGKALRIGAGLGNPQAIAQSCQKLPA